MQFCNLSRTYHPACIVDECVQADRRMLKACGYTWVCMYAAGPQATGWCTASTTTSTVTAEPSSRCDAKSPQPQFPHPFVLISPKAGWRTGDEGHLQAPCYGCWQCCVLAGDVSRVCGFAPSITALQGRKHCASLHPAPQIPYIVSCILGPASHIWNPVFCIPCPANHIPYTMSCTLHPATYIQRPAPHI